MADPRRPELRRALEILAELNAAMLARDMPRPILVGGAAAEYYSGSALMTGDFDLTSPVQVELEEELVKLGFHKPGGLGHTAEGWVHPDLQFGFEIVASSPMGGNIDPARIALVSLEGGGRLAITPIEDLIADRMGQFASGTAPEMREQARTLLALNPDVEKDYLDRRIREETFGDCSLGDIEA